MTNSKAPDSAAADARGAIGISPSKALSLGLSPRWVQYSGVSVTAHALADILTDFTISVTTGDETIELDMDLLAYLAHLGRGDKVMPFLLELEAIGFLTIYGGRIDPLTGKRRQLRDSNGKPIKYRFSIDREPPAAYRGPKNLNEVYEKFREDRDAAYEAAATTNKRAKASNVTIRRSSVGYLDKTQVSADTGFRGPADAADTGIRGPVEFQQVSADTGFRGPSSFKGSSILEEGEKIKKPEAGSAAAPPATGKDEQRWAAANELVRAADWNSWGKHVFGPHYVPTEDDVCPVVEAVNAAWQRYPQLTPNLLAAVLDYALGKAHSTGYLVGAFNERNLPTNLKLVGQYAKLSAAPAVLSPTPRPWAPPVVTLVADAVADKPAPGTTTEVPVPNEQCDNCGNDSTVPLSRRWIVRDDATPELCPVCNPVPQHT